MSISPAKRASMSEGPALKTFASTFRGATARSKSPDATPRTAWACVRFAKYPIVTFGSFAREPLRHAASPATRTMTRRKTRTGLFGLTDTAPHGSPEAEAAQPDALDLSLLQSF